MRSKDDDPDYRQYSSDSDASNIGNRDRQLSGRNRRSDYDDASTNNNRARSSYNNSRSTSPTGSQGTSRRNSLTTRESESRRNLQHKKVHGNGPVEAKVNDHHVHYIKSISPPQKDNGPKLKNSCDQCGATKKRCNHKWPCTNCHEKANKIITLCKEQNRKKNTGPCSRCRRKGLECCMGYPCQNCVVDSQCGRGECTYSFEKQRGRKPLATKEAESREKMREVMIEILDSRTTPKRKLFEGEEGNYSTENRRTRSNENNYADMGHRRNFEDQNRGMEEDEESEDRKMPAVESTETEDKTDGNGYDESGDEHNRSGRSSSSKRHRVTGRVRPIENVARGARSGSFRDTSVRTPPQSAHTNRNGRKPKSQSERNDESHGHRTQQTGRSERSSGKRYQQHPNHEGIVRIQPPQSALKTPPKYKSKAPSHYRWGEEINERASEDNEEIDSEEDPPEEEGNYTNTEDYNNNRAQYENDSRRNKNTKKKYNHGRK